MGEGLSAECCGCATGGQLTTCKGVLDRIGVIKVHWESWSDCNLSCGFCYRQRSSTLSTEDAIRLIGSIAFGGAQQFVFAGGDPSLRKDLAYLIDAAHRFGLEAEVQTNAHYQNPSVINALLSAELIGLSLDGPNSTLHDRFRNKKDNFVRVLELMNMLESKGRPFMVRSVVAKPNAADAPAVGELLSQYKQLKRWSVVQFSPIGEGFINRQKYEISEADFLEAAALCKERFMGKAEVNIYPNSAKSGIYFMAGSAGDIFGDIGAFSVVEHPLIGNLLSAHISAIAQKLAFNENRHANRYARLMD
jgi:MoaA/NifB/PqqE/SkfB family radical SAM enzyme